MENISFSKSFPPDIYISRDHVTSKLWGMGMMPWITRGLGSEMITSELQEVIDESFSQYQAYLGTMERTHLPFRDTSGQGGMWELFERWHKRNRRDLQRVSHRADEILEKPEG